MRKPIIVLLFLTVVPISGFFCYALYWVGQASREAAQLEEDARPKVNHILNQGIASSQNLRASSESLKQTVNRLNMHIDDETLDNLRNYAYNGLNSSEIAVNNTSRIVDATVKLLTSFEANSKDSLTRLPKTLDKLDSSLDKLNNETIPATTNTIISAGRTLDTANNQAAIIGTAMEQLLNKAGVSIDQVNTLLKDERIKNILTHADSSMAHIDVTLGEVAEAAPEFFTNLNRLLAEGGRLSKESADFLHSINAPTTKKQKAFRFLLQTISILAPFAVRH